MKLSLFLHDFLSIAAPIVFVVLAVLIERSPHKPLYTRIWALVCVLTALTWSAIFLADRGVDSIRTAEMIARVAISFGATTCLFIYAFPLAYLSIFRRHRRRFIALAAVNLVLVVLFLTSNLLIESMVHDELMRHKPKPGPLMPLYLLYVVFCTGMASAHFLSAYRKSSGFRKLQLRYFLFAMVIFLISGVGSLLPMFGPGTLLSWLPMTLMILVPTTVTYAIIRHRLWDIRTVIHKTALWLTVSAVTVIPIYLLVRIAMRYLANVGEITAFAIATILYLLVLVSLRWIQPRVDRLFGRHQHNARELLATFIREARDLRQPTQLVESLADALAAMLSPMFVRVLVTESNGELGNLFGPAEKPLSAERCQPLLTNGAGPLDCSAASGSPGRTEQEMFHERKAFAVIPLVRSERLLGLVELGERRDLKAYTAQDFEFMERIQDAASVALSNAKHFDELQALTVSLEERVEERTQQLSNAYDQLQDLDQLKSRFFTNITHELRTPLTLILAPLEDRLLEERDDEHDRHTLVMMHRQAVKLFNMINDLLDLSKIDAGQLRLRVERIDLTQFIQQIVSGFVGVAAGKGIALTFAASDRALELLADRDKLERVFINLLANAVKFTPEGGTIAVEMDETETSIAIAVRDTGIGIPAEEIDAIFDRFAQVEDSMTRRFEGTGIGLSLVKEIVEMHKGAVSVESTVGEGSCFRVDLLKGRSHLGAEDLDRRHVDIPTGHRRRINDSSVGTLTRASLFAATATQENGPDPRNEISDFSAPARIVVVEDNDDMRAFLAHKLSGYRVRTAADGEAGLALVRSELPDLILSDVMMPRMSGYELCRTLKSEKATHQIPVILLTAKKGVDRTLEGFQSGADDYLTKPFNTRELLARIQVQLKLRDLSRLLANQEKISLLGLVSSGLAHEVKNPANAVINAVPPLRTLVQTKSAENLESIAELLDMVADCGNRIVALCDDLLGLAEPGNAGIGRWEVQKAIDATVRILQRRYGATIAVAVDCRHSHAVLGSRLHLNQVLMNLLSNAMRAVSDHSGAGTIMVSTENHNGWFVLKVRDDGPGIPREDQERVFDPLFTTADVGEGTGLGLYITRRIVDAHHGRITLDSSPGEGAAFTIELPVEPTSEQLAHLSSVRFLA